MELKHLLSVPLFLTQINPLWHITLDHGWKEQHGLFLLVPPSYYTEGQTEDLVLGVQEPLQPEFPPPADPHETELWNSRWPAGQRQNMRPCVHSPAQTDRCTGQGVWSTAD